MIAIYEGEGKKVLDISDDKEGNTIYLIEHHSNVASLDYLTEAGIEKVDPRGSYIWLYGVDITWSEYVVENIIEDCKLAKVFYGVEL